MTELIGLALGAVALIAGLYGIWKKDFGGVPFIIIGAVIIAICVYKIIHKDDNRGEGE